jgi:uncharacterized membrane protein YdjX (TVP38/TMEM64 family)
MPLVMPTEPLESAASSPPAGSARGATKKALLALAVVVALAFGGQRLAQELRVVVAWIQELGPLAPIVFIGLYSLCTVAFVPGVVLTLSAGALFGLGLGTFYTFVAATVGSSLAFLVSRYAIRGAVERKLAANPRFAALDRAVARDGRRIVFLLRLSPVFPFNALNYALGATNVRFVDYVVASPGMLPVTLLYVYYGKLAGDVALAAGGLAPARGPEYYAVLGLGLAATVAAAAFVTRIARRALAQAEHG